MDPLTDLQKAVVAAIRGDAACMAILYRVYDDVPSNPYGDKTAYASFGSEDTNTVDLHDVEALDHVIQIDVWSKAQGAEEVKKACHAIKKVLHEQELVLQDHGFGRCELERQRIMRDPRPDVRHGAMQFLFEIEDQG